MECMLCTGNTQTVCFTWSRQTILALGSGSGVWSNFVLASVRCRVYCVLTAVWQSHSTYIYITDPSLGMVCLFVGNFTALAKLGKNRRGRKLLVLDMSVWLACFCGNNNCMNWAPAMMILLAKDESNKLWITIKLSSSFCDYLSFKQNA